VVNFVHYVTLKERKIDLEQKCGVVGFRTYTTRTRTPTKLLPEPDWAREIGEVNRKEFGWGDYSMRITRDATSFWQDGAVPADDYMEWYAYFVMSGPYGINKQHSILTRLPGAPRAISDKYSKIWTPPVDLGVITITAGNGPDKPLSFKSASGKSGTLDLATGKWSFDN